MTDNLSHKKKFYLLLFGTVVLLLLAYNLSVSETLKLKNNCRGLEQRSMAIGNAPVKSMYYQKELQKIDSLIGADNYKGNYVQERLLEKITKYSNRHNMLVENFPSPHWCENPPYSIFTYKIDVQGRFYNLLGLLYELETGNYPGIIKCSRFLLKRIPGAGTESLTMSLYIQDIKPIQNEEAD